MSNDNNIKNFTASDIEKYHHGQLSANEMHALEKAALDDPFLADALEGYATTRTNVTADIAELKRRLAEKTEHAKVIPLHAGGTRSFPWLRTAVMVILLAGAGVLGYQFLFTTRDDKSISELKANRNKEVQKEAAPAELSPTDTSGNSSVYYKANDKSGDDKLVFGDTIDKRKTISTSNNGTAVMDKDSMAVASDLTATHIANDLSKPAAGSEQREDFKKIDPLAKQNIDSVSRKNDIALKDETKRQALNEVTIGNVNGIMATNKKAKEESEAKGYSRKFMDSYTNTNLFRGQVTDANGGVLPFANITNRVDNVGTYSDAQGYFTLVSPDTVLDVQVRSLGFENRNVQLRRSVINNPVTMQEDRSLSAFVLDTVKRNISRVPNTMTFEEPEPVDGWPAYGSYVLNNLNVPDEVKKTGQKTDDNTVQVSFEVNKNGEPINIKIEKSLCDKCDKEAIRVIKDGPKWKRKAKKGNRTTVTVPFVKP